MGQTVNLGGDRLGSGNKMNVHLHNYERSTHDLGYLWRSTMSSGTLVPFMKILALPGDTFDINLGMAMNTHPTIGPLFGSYKAQLDVFECPVRLYQGKLHNNALGIGMNMSSVKLPLLELLARQPETTDVDNSQINPSCILSYLGIRGIGIPDGENQNRRFNALPFLMYWDIYKNYYANKQEEIGAVIHNESPALVETVDSIEAPTGTTIPESPATDVVVIAGSTVITLSFTGATPIPSQIILDTSQGEISLQDLMTDITTGVGTITGIFNYGRYGIINVYSWRYLTPTEVRVQQPEVSTFPLSNLDDMRNAILADVNQATAFIVNTDGGMTPYTWPLSSTNGFPNALSSQEGLAVKTYQSDLFNNWLSTEWIDGTGGITEVTAIDTSGGSFTLDTLNLSKKVYDMLNRIAVSGGSYNDWLNAVYDKTGFMLAESPMYMGGLIKELVFQEVVSNSESSSTSMTGGATQPLGTLAGKGILAKKHKGGQVTVKVNEPSYIIGIVSLTPRVDYSQGNDWDVHLLTMDDFHKPALDEIGFQELITEQMAWKDTEWSGTAWVQKSAGKQPAWINYMTAVNKTYGNFAIGEPVGEMFMTLNRRYEGGTGGIEDLTTYIDPAKFNFIFAETALDAQNFWVQISIDIDARRKISAKVMPNL